MPTRDQIYDTLFDWVSSVAAPATVDWEDGDDADRTGLRVSLRMIENRGGNFPDREISVGVGDTGDESISEQALITLVVNTRGKGSEDLAWLLRASAWSSQRFGYNGTWGEMGLGSVSTVLDLSELESAQIENRYEFRVKLHTTIEHTLSADYAETIEVSVQEGRLGIISINDYGNDPHPIPEDC